MKYFLDDFVNTLSTDGARRTSYVLADAKIEKEQFAAIEAKLEKNLAIGKVELSPVTSTDLVSGSDMESKFRELDLTISEIFRRSNDISLLLDNYVGVLGADIKALEDELAVLEKNVNNYAFLIADNGAFDFAYLDGFSDERGREIDLPEIPDRAGRSFSVGEWARIDSQSGELTMTNFGLGSHRWPISDVRMVQSNVMVFMTEKDRQTLGNIIQPRVDNGWKASIKSPSLILGQMPGFIEEGTENFAGAQFILEFTLASPAPCDTITLLPFSDWGFTLSEVRVYTSDDDSIYTRVLNEPTSIDHPYNVNFPTTVATRFRLYLRQPTYRRTLSRPLAAEDRNKKIFDELFEKNVVPDDNKKDTPITSLTGSRSSYGWWDQRMFMFLEDKKIHKPESPYAIGIPKADFRKNWGSFSYRSSRLERKTFESNKKAWDNEDWVSRLVSDVIKDIAQSEAIWGTVLNSQKQVKPAWAPSADNLRTSRDPSMPFTSTSVNPKTVQPLGEGQATMPYVYKVGLKHVEVGQSTTEDRMVFVSRRMDAPGDIGTVRIKSEYTNQRVTDTDRDSDRITSVEYSVTSVAKPVTEADWIPILPIDTEEIIGERLFPDASGKCILRFSAKIEAPIRIYINGYQKKNYDIQDVARRKDSKNGQSYDALTIPVTDYTSSDILTVDYTPSHDFTTIDFPALDPASSPPLVSSYDADGAGEGFTSSANQLVVDLLHNPYIDYRQVATSTYDADHGLNGYSPLTVRFADGTIAYNLTNYKGGTQTVLDPSSSDVQYLQSGKTLMFNKVLTNPFRVFYQFQPSDVRVRIVLRCNYNQFVTPRVDYFQLKAKTKKSDAKRKL